MTQRSPFEQAAMRYCCPRGIPLTRFTEQRLGPPDWTEADVVVALEWQAEQDRQCPDCGADTDESMKKENAYVYRAKAFRCHSCYAIAAASAKQQRGKVSTLAGTRWQVTKEVSGDGRVDEPGADGSET